MTSRLLLSACLCVFLSASAYAACSLECINGGTLDSVKCVCDCDADHAGDECQWKVTSCALSCAANESANTATCTCEACSVNCQNGGTPGDNCGCICPNGFGGDICQYEATCNRNCTKPDTELNSGTCKCVPSTSDTTPEPTSGASEGTTSGSSASDSSAGTTSGSSASDSSAGTTSGSSASDSSAGTTSGSSASDSSAGTTSGSSASDSSAGTTSGSSATGSSAGTTSGSSASDSSAGTTPGSSASGSSAGTTSGSSASDSSAGTTPGSSASDSSAGTTSVSSASGSSAEPTSGGSTAAPTTLATPPPGVNCMSGESPYCLVADKVPAYKVYVNAKNCPHISGTCPVGCAYEQPAICETYGTTNCDSYPSFKKICPQKCGDC
ncbi:cell wall protein AWA1-like [Gigantopelta aegis]|uniref:cell wall protein AWA1-like n=1 Tax=Gigantopelta aegis TaxID=1735272 RepID=UPI001B88CB43|nr:cell wall protein AWA1-like [Gigantopelta aegis]